MQGQPDIPARELRGVQRDARWVGSSLNRSGTLVNNIYDMTLVAKPSSITY
jgi:hypothetical protein